MSMDDKLFRQTVFSFGQKPLIIFLAFMNGFVPLSIDLYLPALPGMARYFAAPESSANLTLSLFMLFFGLSMLLWGPLSDRLGRKKLLFTGLILYILGSMTCALAGNMTMLVFGRVVQATGCGAVQAVSMAIVKDVFQGRIMENVLIWIQMTTVICPMAAPVLGAFLLDHMSWRGLFWVLLSGGAAGLLIAMAGLRETLEKTSPVPVLHSLSRIGSVLGNKSLRSLLLLFALTSMPFMTYLSTSAFIYQDMFHTSARTYGFFFAANAGFSVLGPFSYMRFFRTISRVLFIGICFAATAVAGVLLLLFGDLGPFAFALLFLPVSFFGSAGRPVGTVLMMSQLETDNATVASLIGSTGLFFGSLAMLSSTLPWPSPVIAVGAMSLMVGLLCLVLWMRVNRNRSYRLPEEAGKC